MATVVPGVVLVGHGGIPKGCPQELVTKLKRMAPNWCKNRIVAGS